MKKMPKLRRRAYNLLLCLLAVAVAVAAVAAADALESRFAARIDLSFNSVTTQSEATAKALQSLDKDVHAYVLATQGNTLTDLNALLDRYQAATPRFTWSQERLSRNPLLLQWMSDDVSDSAVTGDCVIVRCADTGRTRVLTWEDYMSFGYNPDSGAYEFTGLTYEKALTEAILYTAADEIPALQLLSGHGELTAAETAVLEKKLTEANYAPLRVNLKNGDTLDPAAPLLILSPTLDVDEGELSALTAFAQAGGSLLVTVDFTDPDVLPNLYAFYRLYGVQPLPGLVVADEGDRSGYYTSPIELTPTLRSVEGVTDGLVQSGANFLILAPARALDLVGTQSADLLMEPLLQSGEGSYLRAAQGGSIDITRQAEDPEGPFTLAVLCDRGFGDGTRSRACFIGNSGMFLNDTLYNLTYSNELMQQVLRALMGSSPIDLDILPRAAARPVLAAQGSAVPVILLILPPLLIALLAVAILTPRKYL